MVLDPDICMASPGHRRIVSWINAFDYNLAEVLVRITQPLTTNEHHTTASTFDFVNKIIMVSFDVKSSFTNVRLSETRRIIMDTISDESLSQFALNKEV